MARQNITHSENTLKTAEDELNKAMRVLETEGKAALEKAQQRSREFGQQSEKMTTIAQEARNIGEELELGTKDVVVVAEDAKTKSIEAYDLAKNVTDQQKNISRNIHELKVELSGIETELEKIKEFVAESHNHSSDAKNKALALLSEVSNLQVPEVDIGKLRTKANVTKNEAKRIIDDTDKLLNKTEALLNNIQDNVLLAEELIVKGIEQRTFADELLQDIDLAKAQAERAVKLGDDTLSKATATYETLSRKRIIFYL